MAPARVTRKRKSDQSISSVEDEKVPTKMVTPENSSPVKKRKLGLTLAQKQALIDNLQLEITERARRLRAQYHIQAQQLRSRVEMRVNRIPTTLRRLKMGDLLSKSLQPPQPPPSKPAYVAIPPPPVPAKDRASPSPKAIARKPVPISSAPLRGHKRLSDEMSGANKENQGEAVDHPKKKLRGAPSREVAQLRPGQVLSPASSNTRVVPRDRPTSPIKSMIARPASPVKAPVKKPSSNILSNMVEKARGTRPATATATRKATTSSTASSNPGTTTTTTRTRKAAPPAPPSSAAGTRGRRKNSDTSEGSTATVVKKTTASRAAKTTAAPASKRTVMGTIKSATTKKAPASKAAAAAPATGRTLRKRA
ncbi:Borealin N terminal-domain-containing protein [Whalleya microplaca]|nr:Borealin N terminal-domain-containing protein [Whalleya microplaca]